jgi:hypothetical protein
VYVCARRLLRVSIPERYILMCETDHLFLRPLPNLMQGDAQAAALFTCVCNCTCHRVRVSRAFQLV